MRAAVLWEFPFGIQYAWMLLIFAMTTVYSLLCPLITPFGQYGLVSYLCCHVFFILHTYTAFGRCFFICLLYLIHLFCIFICFASSSTNIHFLPHPSPGQVLLSSHVML